ncbi:MAG: S-layer homology domain-containing protein [Actinomycetota bacterium]|nr:S-layer homology domain-containing protein [Actinomycetota bacterium]
MRRPLVALFALALLAALPGVAAGHDKFDHPVPSDAPEAPLSSTVNSGGEGADWELITSIPTGNPHTDLDFFTQGGETYASVGTLAVGPNGGGQTIVKLTEKGEVVPSLVSNQPSASCVSNPTQALGLQHDVEATPKGAAVLNTGNRFAVRTDAQLIVDATDAEGRCHDQGTAGLEVEGEPEDAPQGGLEIVDITKIGDPVEIGLTSHIGEAHTVNIDPKRPHIAYAVTSDAVAGNEDRTLQNGDPGSTERFDLDGFEVVDMSSCMNFPADAPTEQKRAQCRPEVYRFEYPTPEIALGHTQQQGSQAVFGCHETEIYPNDLLTCGGGNAAILFDMSGAFDDNGTPDDFTDDKPRGEPLPCRVRPSTSEAIFRTGAMVTDCVNGGTDENPIDLSIPGWKAIGEPSLEGVRHLGSAHHQGRGAGTNLRGGDVTSAFDATEDVDFNHETELTKSRDFLIATDERGGGVVPPGASCSPGVDNTQGNGGLHAYAVDRLDTELPESAEEAFDAYARTPNTGEKAIYRAEIRTQPEGAFCTAHVMQQVPGQNRIFMGWYTQGTQVVDFAEYADGTFMFRDAGFFIPENANTWVSHVFKVDENKDGSFTYFGATGDFNFGTAGRNTIDIYKVTLPAPEEGPCALAPEAVNYVDRDEAREVHRDNVDCVIFRSIAQGEKDGDTFRYNPRQTVTRGQMATFIVNSLRAAGLDDRLPDGGGLDEFDDIAGSVHRNNINTLGRAGIVSGVGRGDYRPNGRVSRQQMATFLVQAAEFGLDRPLNAKGDHFGDVAERNLHDDNIDAGFEAGLFRGTKAPQAGKPDSGKFSPLLDVPRDQMATFLVNLLRFADK